MLLRLVGIEVQGRRRGGNLDEPLECLHTEVLPYRFDSAGKCRICLSGVHNPLAHMKGAGSVESLGHFRNVHDDLHLHSPADDIEASSRAEGFPFSLQLLETTSQGSDGHCEVACRRCFQSVAIWSVRYVFRSPERHIHHSEGRQRLQREPGACAFKTIGILGPGEDGEVSRGEGQLEGFADASVRPAEIGHVSRPNQKRPSENLLARAVDAGTYFLYPCL